MVLNSSKSGLVILKLSLAALTIQSTQICDPSRFLFHEGLAVTLCLGPWPQEVKIAEHCVSCIQSGFCLMVSAAVYIF